jgi:hypothetical protein
MYLLAAMIMDMDTPSCSLRLDLRQNTPEEDSKQGAQRPQKGTDWTSQDLVDTL